MNTHLLAISRIQASPEPKIQVAWINCTWCNSSDNQFFVLTWEHGFTSAIRKQIKEDACVPVRFISGRDTIVCSLTPYKQDHAYTISPYSLVLKMSEIQEYFPGVKPQVLFRKIRKAQWLL